MSILDYINNNSQQDACIRAIVKAKYELRTTTVSAKVQQLNDIINQNIALLRNNAQRKAKINPNILQETDDVINNGIDEIVNYMANNYVTQKSFKENYWNALHALHQPQQQQQTPRTQNPPAPDPQNPPAPDPQNPPAPDPQNNNLPVVSGLQIYDKVLQEIGYIKGTKAIKAHDVAEHMFGIKIFVPKLIELFTGRKKEIKRIVDAMDNIDFQQEFGLSNDEAINLMIDDCLLKEGERSTAKLKVNDIFLRALKQKLDRDMQRKTEYYTQLSEQALEEIGRLETERQTATPQRQAEIDESLGDLYNITQNTVRRIEHFEDQSVDIERAREAKSYSKHNIEGSDAAVRDVDNRDAVHRAAEAEKKILDARRQGGIDAATGKTAQYYEYELAKLMAGETKDKKAFIGKGKVSIGAFDSALGKAKKMSDRDNNTMDITTGIGAALIGGAVVASNQLNQMGDVMLAQQQVSFRAQQGLQQAQAQIDQQTAAANQMSGQIQNIKGSVTQNDVAHAVQAVRKPAIDSSDMGERASEFLGNFNEGSQAYINADSSNVGFATQQLSKADQYITQHSGKAQNPLSALIDAMKQQTALHKQNISLAQDAQNAAGAYYGTSNPGGNLVNLVSRAGVDHTAVAAAETTGRVLAETANIQTQEAAIKILEQIQNISSQNVSRIDLTQYMDFSSLIAATRGKGIDLFAILAPSVMQIDNMAKDNIRNQGRS